MGFEGPGRGKKGLHDCGERKRGNTRRGGVRIGEGLQKRGLLEKRCWSAGVFWCVLLGTRHKFEHDMYGVPHTCTCMSHAC